MSFVCLLFPRDLLTPILFVSMSATDVPVNFVAVLVTALSAAECTPSFTLPTSGTILDVKKKLCAQMIVSPWRQRLLLHDDSKVLSDGVLLKDLPRGRKSGPAGYSLNEELQIHLPKGTWQGIQRATTNVCLKRFNSWCGTTLIPETITERP